MRTPSASVLVEPLDAYLGRRARSASPLAPGEAVTIAVGLLRGCRQATGRLTGARWWLRADGCPVAVEEDESPDAIAATSAVLERLATMASDHPTREVLARARESVLTQPPRDWDALERRLFQHAAPHPLILGPLTPVERELPPPIDPLTAGSGTRVLAFIDADLAESVGEVISDLRARWRSSRALRMGVVGAAATLVAVVCVLAWPQPVTPDASAPGVPSTTAADVADPDVADPDITPPRRQASPLPPATDSVASGAEPSHASDGAPLDDPVASARALFALSDGCNGDVSCLASFVEDADSLGDRLLPGAATADVGLIDDFGDVAVVRLSRDAQLQYVTLVRQEDRWLVRAVETVADQPS